MARCEPHHEDHELAVLVPLDDLLDAQAGALADVVQVKSELSLITNRNMNLLEGSCGRQIFIQALVQELAHWFNGIGEAEGYRINMHRQRRQRRNYVSNPGHAPVADCLCQHLNARVGGKVQVIREFDQHRRVPQRQQCGLPLTGIGHNVIRMAVAVMQRGESVRRFNSAGGPTRSYVAQVFEIEKTRSRSAPGTPKSGKCRFPAADTR